MGSGGADETRHDRSEDDCPCYLAGVRSMRTEYAERSETVCEAASSLLGALAAMPAVPDPVRAAESPAPEPPRVGICGARFQASVCALPAEHAGWHQESGVHPMSWTEEAPVAAAPAPSDEATALTDLRDRTARAAYELRVKADQTDFRGERGRLHAKAEGVSLALSYIAETIATGADEGDGPGGEGTKPAAPDDRPTEPSTQDAERWAPEDEPEWSGRVIRRPAQVYEDLCGAAPVGDPGSAEEDSP